MDTLLTVLLSHVWKQRLVDLLVVLSVDKRSTAIRHTPRCVDIISLMHPVPLPRTIPLPVISRKALRRTFPLPFTEVVVKSISLSNKRKIGNSMKSVVVHCCSEV